MQLPAGVPSAQKGVLFARGAGKRCHFSRVQQQVAAGHHRVTTGKVIWPQPCRWFHGGTEAEGTMRPFHAQQQDGFFESGMLVHLKAAGEFARPQPGLGEVPGSV